MKGTVKSSNFHNIYETYVPISEKYATLSFMSLAPTLMAEGAALGEPRHALQPRRTKARNLQKTKKRKNKIGKQNEREDKISEEMTDKKENIR